MGEIGTSPLIWEEIDRSESYLMSCMHEEAASLASSILQQIHNDNNVSDQAIYEVMESAGMVLVQSLKELGRYSCSSSSHWVLLRRLHSLYSLKATNMSQSSSMLPNKHTLSERSLKGTNTDYFPGDEDPTRQATLNLPMQSYSSFSCFRSSTLKFGNVQTILCSRKISLGFFIFIA